MLSQLPNKKEIALIHKAQILSAMDRALLRKIFGFAPGEVPGAVVKEWEELGVTMDGKSKVPLFTLDPVSSGVLKERAEEVGYYSGSSEADPADAAVSIVEALGEDVKDLKKELKRLDKIIYS